MRGDFRRIFGIFLGYFWGILGGGGGVFLKKRKSHEILKWLLEKMKKNDFFKMGGI